jgi:glycine betaine transporter
MSSKYSKFMRDLKSLPALFWVSGFFVLILFFSGIIFPDKFLHSLEVISQVIFEKFGNYYLFLILISTILLIIVGVSPLGKIRIGGKDARPTHTYFSWFCMIFCCGMGIGVLFWGAAEPLFHFMNPPFTDLAGGLETKTNAFQVSFFHWGISPWAIYGLTTIAIAFWGFNLKKGFYLSSILGIDKNNKASKKETSSIFYRFKKYLLKPVVDLITLIAILFGVAASFGMGILHLEGGFQNVLNVESSTMLKVGIIIAITIAYMISSMRGLDKGIKVISNVSIILSFILLGAVFILSPGTGVIKELIMSIPAFLQKIPAMSTGMANYAVENWLKDWTLMYWSWWIAWTPFVSTFVALISKGRTIREIVLGVLIVPTVFIIAWFTIFGNAAITLQIQQAFFGSTLDLEKVNLILFEMLNYLSGSPLLSILSLVLIAAFFINSADSATYTLASLSNEDLEHEPPKVLQLGWGLMFTCLAALFVLAGGMQALIKVTLISVLPFSLWLIVVFCAMFYKMTGYYKREQLIEEDEIKLKHRLKPKLRVKTTVVSPIFSPIRFD